MKLGLSFLLLTSTLLPQENKLFWDGRDWQRLTQQTAGYPEYTYLTKAGYVNGLLDGRLFDYFRAWSADSSLADSLFRGEIVDYLKTSELVRGLDNFYADPLNNYIPISSAIIIVNMYGEGQPTAVIEAYTARSKEWINRLLLQMQKTDMFDLMREKQKEQVEKREK
ncbi:MAG: hypothetical protein ACE5GH_07815 [Fidelibacterota bacterium]